eukprot:TRINITY_DN11720_c0_g1_i2.p1 TRINITY_DN11720_c0_g1~~TRINITY_DN11720_c0_g1_i2.p1  ORF type:complete len:161 (-),score=64.36 TRINITY_DN11720_c0_g1_i2:73-555(-)
MFSLLLLCLCPLHTGASPVAPHGKEGALANAGLSLAAQFAHPTCDTKQVPDSVCAILYDEEHCKDDADLLELVAGDQGVLPLISRGLRRNDVESLIVHAQCKLELWDSHHGLERQDRPDLVIDREQEFRNLYVDSLARVDEYAHMDEKISGYRCSCRQQK